MLLRGRDGPAVGLRAAAHATWRLRQAGVPCGAAAVGLYAPATNCSAPAYALSRAAPPAVNALLLPYVNKL